VWNVRKGVSVIIGVTGTISKSFIKYLNNIPGKHEIKRNTENSPIAHTSVVLM
jgi:hypothetical protein